MFVLLVINISKLIKHINKHLFIIIKTVEVLSFKGNLCQISFKVEKCLTNSSYLGYLVSSGSQ